MYIICSWHTGGSRFIRRCLIQIPLFSKSLANSSPISTILSFRIKREAAVLKHTRALFRQVFYMSILRGFLKWSCLRIFSPKSTNWRESFWSFFFSEECRETYQESCAEHQTSLSEKSTQPERETFTKALFLRCFCCSSGCWQNIAGDCE